MSIFRCSKCGYVDNTALTNHYKVLVNGADPLCSECDPDLAKWHGRFKRMTPEELNVVEGPDGYLYDPKDKYLERLRAAQKKKGPS